MKILVTGIAGFIGFNISKELLNRGYKIVGLDNINDYYDVGLKKDRLESLQNENLLFYKVNITDKEKISYIFEKELPDLVLHLAAQAGVRYSLINPDSYVENNILGFFNIIEQCRTYSIKHFYYASSSSVYGNNQNVPYEEEGMVDKPLNLYSASKKTNEDIAYAYSNLYNMNCVGLRFFTVYGPWGRPDMAYFKFVKNIYLEEGIKVFGNGKMKRDFTYIDDVVEAVIRLMETSQCKEPESINSSIFNIGNSKPVELTHFIQIIEESLGKSAKKTFLNMQPGDMFVTCASTKKLKDEIDFAPTITIEEGIPKFVEWYKNYYKLN